MTSMRAIDLFCGCGGMSAGLRLAGVDVIAGVDVEQKYIATFAENFPNARALVGDLSKTTPNDFMSQIGIVKGELDILVGGPPCQGFSKNTPRKFRYLEDPRNLLIKTFLDYCESLLPKLIIIENVAEMKKGFDDAYSLEIIERLNNAGYQVTTEVLNAADYGVPQNRKRAFFVANRSDIAIDIPKPTHFALNGKKNANSQKSLFNPEKTHITVWEAISDLPSLQHDDGEPRSTYSAPPENPYQELMRKNAPSAIQNHIPRLLKSTQYERLSSLKPGQGHKDLPDHLKVASGYSGAYGRLTKDMVAPTITRWVFHPGSGRWGHPVDIRTLTMREVARIQSFPDSYKFIGSYNEQAGQLGNAVPPLLAYEIAKSAINQLGLNTNNTEV